MEVAPLPKSQAQAVGLPVDRSWNLTTMGAQPPVMSDVKFGVGAWASVNRDRIKHNAVSAVLFLKTVFFSYAIF